MFFVMRTTGTLYAVVFIVTWLALPPWLLVFSRLPVSTPLAVAAELAVMASFVFTYWMCSSPVVSYWIALSVMGGRFRTGIVQLSIMIAVPAIALYNVYFLGVALLALVLGRRFAQRMLVKSAYGWLGGAFRLEPALAEIDRLHSYRAERQAARRPVKRVPPKKVARLMDYSFDAPVENIVPPAMPVEPVSARRGPPPPPPPPPVRKGRMPPPPPPPPPPTGGW